MIEIQTTTSIIGAIVVVVISICESIKAIGVPSRYIPLISVILGILGSWTFDHINFLTTLTGVILGLATTGGYRLIKTTLLNK